MKNIIVLVLYQFAMNSANFIDNYRKVYDFNKAVGNETKLDYSCLNPKLVGQKTALIVEEIKELLAAVDQKNNVEILDALVDILYVAYGAGAAFNRDMNQCLAEFHHEQILQVVAKDFDSYYPKTRGDSLDILSAILSPNSPEYDPLYTCNFSRISHIMEQNRQEQSFSACLKFMQDALEEYKNILNLETVGHCQTQIFLNFTTDVIFVTYALAYHFNVDINRAFDRVHQANMTKLCNTLEIAEKTVQWYLDRPDMGYESPTIRETSVNNTTFWIVYNKSSNKVLKSIEWQIADLTDLAAELYVEE